MKNKNQTNFVLLSLREEKQLSKEELEKYYDNLRNYALNRKLTNTTAGALTICPKIKKVVEKISTAITKILAGGKIEVVVDGQENIPDGAVIFASTHQSVLDTFCYIPYCPKHCLILHNSDVNKLLLLAQVDIGLILVSKVEEDVQNRINAKLDMIKILLKNHSIWWFPEGTWNLSPNKLYLPMSFGFLEIAKKTQVPVIPVVMECTYDSSTEKERITKLHITYGKPIKVGLDDDLSQKLLEYEEVIATIRWNLIEEKGLFQREKITNWEYINYLKGNYKNLELGKKNLELERRRIFGAGSEFYKFHHINDVPFNENGELLETELVQKLKNMHTK